MSLLPSNTTPLERAVEAVSQLPTAQGLVPTLWHAQTCPEPFLPWLAWAMSVDDWDPAWSTQRKRQAIAESIEIHELKGTPSAIKRILAIRGHEDAEVIERSDFIRHDGQHLRDGTYSYGGEAKWAVFKVILKRPVSIKQTQEIIRLINNVKRNCCHLKTFDFQEALLLRDGTHRYDGTYTRGVVTN